MMYIVQSPSQFNVYCHFQNSNLFLKYTWSISKICIVPTNATPIEFHSQTNMDPVRHWVHADELCLDHLREHVLYNTDAITVP